MDKIRLMVNGLPGNVAKNIVNHVLKDQRFDLVPFSLTGAGIGSDAVEVGTAAVTLLSPEKRDSDIQQVKDEYGPFISIDYTHPSAVNENADFYCTHKLPFIMGTTGGDRDALTARVESSDIQAVIAPNMAKQIVGFQAMMEYAAETFPDLFKGFTLHVKESHQKGKADTSGTAKAVVSYFNRLGVPFETDEIIKVREPEEQLEMGIPQEHLGGHGWHTYTLTSDDETVKFAFTHNINGRDVYSHGTFDAAIFLSEKIKETSGGRVFSMIDVLKGK